MNEKEELRNELVEELEWVKYRLKMLEIMEKKLFQMKDIAEHAVQNKLNEEEKKSLNKKMQCLASQFNGINSESKK